jgi:hypothetical protein
MVILNFSVYHAPCWLFPYMHDLGGADSGIRLKKCEVLKSCDFRGIPLALSPYYVCMINYVWG